MGLYHQHLIASSHHCTTFLLFTNHLNVKSSYRHAKQVFYASQKKQGKYKNAQRHQRFQESDYMDPNQGLCLGALFDIAATNVSAYRFDLNLIHEITLAHLIGMKNFKFAF